jgi:hypothetical protein
MKNKTKNWIIAVLIGVVLIGIFFWGYGTGKRNNLPIVVNDTIWRVDTVEHRIVDTFPWYIVKRDSVIYRDTVFKDVDTSEILKDYFAIHYHSRTWEDSLLLVKSEDAITENYILDHQFTYKIKRPQSIVNVVDNKISYSSYIYAGVTGSKNSLFVGGFYADRRLIFGLGYDPFNKAASASFGLKIASFKK